MLIFLKGSKEAKMTRKQKEPEQYSYFQSVWDIRSRHMITGFPLQYVFHACVLLPTPLLSSSMQNWHANFHTQMVVSEELRMAQGFLSEFGVK